MITNVPYKIMFTYDHKCLLQNNVYKWSQRIFSVDLRIIQNIMNFVRWPLLKIASLRKCWRKHKCFSVKIFEYDWSTLPSIIVIDLMYEKILGVGSIWPHPSLNKTLSNPVLSGVISHNCRGSWASTYRDGRVDDVLSLTTKCLMLIRYSLT